MNSTDTLTALNGYDGDNIWQDVIEGLDGFDPEASDALGAEQSSDVVVIDRQVYRWTHKDGWWLDERTFAVVTAANVADSGSLDRVEDHVLVVGGGHETQLVCVEPSEDFAPYAAALRDEAGLTDGQYVLDDSRI